MIPRFFLSAGFCINKFPADYANHADKGDSKHKVLILLRKSYICGRKDSHFLEYAPTDLTNQADKNVELSLSWII